MNIEPAERLGMALYHIYLVYADETYFMKPEYNGEKWLVAVRTVNGSGVVDIEGFGRFQLEANSLMFIEVSRLRYLASNGPKWDFYWFEFACDCGTGYPWHEMLTVLSYSWEQTMIQHVFDLLSLPDVLSRTAASSLFNGFLHDWASRWQRCGERPNALREIVFKTISHIQQDLSQPICFKIIADELDISERWLYHAFTKTLGVSPRKYYNDLRMQEASHALSAGLGTVSQIADRLGYSNPFHFSRAFKKKFGCCPSNFLRLERTK